MRKIDYRQGAVSRWWILVVVGDGVGSGAGVGAGADCGDGWDAEEGASWYGGAEPSVDVDAH